MRAYLCVGVVLFTGLTGAGSGVEAQGSRLAAGMAAGRSVGAGGDHYDRRGFALLASLSSAVRTLPPGVLTLGITGSLQGNPDAGLDDCLIVPGHAGCRPRFPLFVGMALEGGWQLARAGSPWSLEVRLGAGPHWTDGVRAVLGTHVQVGASWWPLEHWGLGFDGRLTGFPAVHGRTLALGALLLGVRWREASRQ